MQQNAPAEKEARVNIGVKDTGEKVGEVTQGGLLNGHLGGGKLRATEGPGA